MSLKVGKPVRYLLQALNYLLLIALLAWFSTSPAYRQLGEDQAVITMAFTHEGEVREPCRRRTQEELAKLAPNMRKLEECARERSPVIIRAMLDEHVFYDALIEAPGLYKDGSVDVYHSAKVPVGTHTLRIKMDDSIRGEGFEYHFAQEVSIKPAQILLIDFSPAQGFIIR